MERETELTQSWNPALAALSEKGGGLLKGIPLQIGGAMRNFSLPVSLQEDDGTDISLKDWQLGPRSGSLADHDAATPFSIKPFKGSVRTRFTPADPRVDEGQSSSDHFETPTTPRTPRASSSGSASPSQSSGGECHSDPSRREPARDPPRINDDMGSPSDAQTTAPSAHAPGSASDVAVNEQSRDQAPAEGPSPGPALRARSLRVSFKESKPTSPAPTPQPRSSSIAAPVVRHRSLLKSRSILPSKEVKALQPKWQSSTKIGPTTSSLSSKPHVQAPLHGIKARKGGTPAKRARAAAAAVPELNEPEPEFQSSSGYLSEGRYSARRGSLDSLSMGRDDFTSAGSRRLSSDLTTSPVGEFGESARSLTASPPSLNKSHGRRRSHGRYGDDSDDEEEMKGGMMCGGGISDTRLSGDLARLLSKLCRVSLPLPSAGPKQPHALSKSASSHPRRSSGRSNNNNNNILNKVERSSSKTSSQSWDPSAAAAQVNGGGGSGAREHDGAVLGRHDSLKLLSERCSTAPAPAYDLHKPRKIRTHEPHQHFYRTISKTLDQKLKS